MYVYYVYYVYYETLLLYNPQVESTTISGT